MPPARTMAEWTRSSIDQDEFDQLRERGVIPEATKDLGWRVPIRSEVEARP